MNVEQSTRDQATLDRATLDRAARSCHALSRDLDRMRQAAGRAGAASLAEQMIDLHRAGRG